MSNRRKKRRSLLNLFIILLFVLGFTLIFNAPIRNIIIATNSYRYQLRNISQKEIERNKKAKVSFDFSAVKSVGVQTVISSSFKSHNLPIIGEITIPALKMNLPIFKGVGNTSLLFGAGTMKEENMGEGNYSLAGHNMTGFTADLSILFTPLTKAKVGMFIYLSDKCKTYQYKIDKIERLTPDHVEVINDHLGKNEITLVTCAEARALHRIVVHGNFIKETGE